MILCSEENLSRTQELAVSPLQLYPCDRHLTHGYRMGIGLRIINQIGLVEFQEDDWKWAF